MKGDTFKELARRRAEAEAAKDRLMDDYGRFWGITGEIVGVWVLAILGAAADALVLFGMFFLASKSVWPSVVAALILSAVIQIVGGDSFMKMVKTIHKGKYKGNDEAAGFTRQLIVVTLIFASMFGASLYLSWHTDKPVEAKAEQVMDGRKKDASPIRQFYAAERQKVTDNFSRQIDQLNRQVDRLRADKTTDRSGKRVTRWANLKPINQILTDKIPALQAEEARQIAALNAQEAGELGELQADNKFEQGRFERMVTVVGASTRWFNIGFNLARVIILAGYVMFLVDAMPRPTSSPTSSKPVGPPADKKTPPHETVGALAPVGDPSVVDGIEARRLAAQFQAELEAIRQDREREAQARAAAEAEADRVRQETEAQRRRDQQRLDEEAARMRAELAAAEARAAKKTEPTKTRELLSDKGSSVLSAEKKIVGVELSADGSVTVGEDRYTDISLFVDAAKKWYVRQFTSAKPATREKNAAKWAAARPVLEKLGATITEEGEKVSVVFEEFAPHRV